MRSKRRVLALASILLVACGSGSGPSASPRGSASTAITNWAVEPKCPRAPVPADHLSIGWNGRACSVEVGAGVSAGSLNVSVEASPSQGLASANAFVRVAPDSTTHACSTLASNWPTKAGTYDVTVRHPSTGRTVSKRIWIDPGAAERELQKPTMTLRDVHNGTVLLDDGADLFVARVGSAGGSFRDALTGQDDYRSRTVYNAFDDIHEEGGPPTLTWEAVSGAFAGLSPSATRVGDQLVIHGITRRWSVRSVAEESTMAAWAPHVFIEDWPDAPGESQMSAMLVGNEGVRRVTLRQEQDCNWVEAQDWALPVTGVRVLSAGSFDAGGRAAVLVIAQGGTPARLRLQVAGDSMGKLEVSVDHELPAALTFPSYARAGARAEQDGTVRAAFIGHLPDTGWSLFEVVWRGGGVTVERTLLPLQAIVVGRVDFDGADPMWVVRTADMTMASGHRRKLDESCTVDAIVPGAPFMGGGTIAWQGAAGGAVNIGLCERRPITRTRRPK